MKNKLFFLTLVAMTASLPACLSKKKTKKDEKKMHKEIDLQGVLQLEGKEFNASEDTE